MNRLGVVVRHQKQTTEVCELKVQQYNQGAEQMKTPPSYGPRLPGTTLTDPTYFNPAANPAVIDRLAAHG